MEPMTLGSPTGCIGRSGTPTSPYLPSFLMGDHATPPRGNTLSPNKGRNISFASNTTNAATPTDFNRSVMGQKTLFGCQENLVSTSYSGTPKQTHNHSIAGPPTQGLFDSLACDTTQVETPSRCNIKAAVPFGTPLGSQYRGNQSINESYLTNTANASFNTTRPTSPVQANNQSFGYRTTFNPQKCVTPKYNEFWVTVYGFPPSAISLILSHFSQCGPIIDKVFPSQNGNWIHLKYSSRLECERALNYNEKILANNMIGVTHCKDPSIIDKENINQNDQPKQSVRSLSQASFAICYDEIAAQPKESPPKNSTGLMSKAIDLFFGW